MGDRRTYKDRRRYLIQAVRKRRKRIREKAIEYKGGCCQVCGYSRCSEALEFHHFESTGKDFGISDRGYTRSWDRVIKELDKCILLCANCHREIHTKLQLPREIVVEKSGELKEACLPYITENGNPEPSPDWAESVREGAETRASARTPENSGGSARHPQP